MLKYFVAFSLLVVIAASCDPATLSTFRSCAQQADASVTACGVCRSELTYTAPCSALTDPLKEDAVRSSLISLSSSPSLLFFLFLFFFFFSSPSPHSRKLGIMYYICTKGPACVASLDATVQCTDPDTQCACLSNINSTACGTAEFQSYVTHLSSYFLQMLFFIVS